MLLRSVVAEFQDELEDERNGHRMAMEELGSGEQPGPESRLSLRRDRTDAHPSQQRSCAPLGNGRIGQADDSDGGIEPGSIPPRQLPRRI